MIIQEKKDNENENEIKKEKVRQMKILKRLKWKIIKLIQLID